MWSIHLDPKLPDLTDCSYDDTRIEKQIQSGRIRPETWVSHPCHTEGRIVAALRVPALRQHFSK